MPIININRGNIDRIGAAFEKRLEALAAKNGLKVRFAGGHLSIIKEQVKRLQGEALHWETLLNNKSNNLFPARTSMLSGYSNHIDPFLKTIISRYLSSVDIQFNEPNIANTKLFSIANIGERFERPSLFSEEEKAAHARAEVQRVAEQIVSQSGKVSITATGAAARVRSGE